MQIFPEDGLPELDICGSVETVLASLWTRLEKQFENDTAERARRAGMKTDVQVMDGNAKNRRLVCAALLRHMITCPHLQRSVCVCCPHTSLLGSIFCTENATIEEAPSVDYEIIAHQMPQAGGMDIGSSLRLLIRESGDDNREVWLPEDSIDPRLTSPYFQEADLQRLLGGAQKKKRRMQERRHNIKAISDEMAALADIWNELTKGELEDFLLAKSGPDDLGSAACNTHKETEALAKECAKSAGVLCACLSSNVVTLELARCMIPNFGFLVLGKFTKF